MIESRWSGALGRAIAVGTVLQVAMVLIGHWVAAVAALFAVLGMAISFLAGWLAASWTLLRGKQAALNGAIAGGACALLGIVLSFVLGDVTAAVIGFGTLSSAVTGALGGLAGGALRKNLEVRV
jgi:hypothetical protein